MKRDLKRPNEELAAIAANYDVLQEFRENEVAAYSLIVQRGLLNKLCGHMKRGHRPPVSDDELEEIASKYDSVTDFRKNDLATYELICSRGLLEKLCTNMKRAFNDYTDEELGRIARKYNYRNDFFTNDKAAYSAAYRRGILDEICAHMDWQRMPHGYWTKELCHQIALGYKSRKDFESGRKDAYAAAIRNGWLDDICNHMKPIGNKFKRKIYVFTFSNGYAYVGLAQNPQSRYNQHMTEKYKSPVLKHIKKTGATFEFKILTDWIHKDFAGKVEDDYINQYAAEGWIMLNKQKGGNLGGMTKLYTDEIIRKEIDKYEYYDDFRKGSVLFYKFLSKYNLLAKYCDKMKFRKTPKWYWTLERAIEVVPECKGRMALYKKYPMAWQRLKEAGLLEKYYPLQQVNGPTKIWTLENSLSVVPLCKSRTELAKKYLVAYRTLRDADLLDTYFPAKWKAYTEEEKMNLISNCKTREELRQKHSSVYNWAKNKDLLDKYYPMSMLTMEEIQTALVRCKSRKELHKKYNRVYKWALNNNQLDKYYPSDWAKPYTDKEKIAIITSCKTRTELSSKHSSICEWARGNGLLDKYLPTKHEKLTDKDRIAIIESCKTRTELNRKRLSVYNWAKKNGLLEKYFPK